METLNTQLQPFFEWLLRTTVQASILICVILLLQRILRNKLGIRWYYGLWLLLLVRMSMPWVPQSRTSMFNLVPRSEHLQQIEYVQPAISEQKIESDVTSPAILETVPATPAITTQDSPESVTISPSINTAVQNQLKPDFTRILKILPVLWVMGALFLAVYVGVGNFNLWRIVKSRRPLTDQRILELLEDCKSEMGIQTILGIVATDKVKSPALFGFIRPRLLLPTGMFQTLSRDELRFVFLHELAHLKRSDIYIGWLISILQVLHWFNPLVWLAFRRMRADRELACDALVLDRTQSDEPKSYGRIIVSLLERFSCPRFLPGMAGILESKSQLKRRITMITKFKKNTYQWSPLAVILIIILACVSLPDAIRTRASQTSTTESTAKISLRRIWTGSDVDDTGGPSPDGRYISHMDWVTGDLAVYEIATGKTRRLTNKGSWEDSAEFVVCSRWSPDSKQLAYTWYNKNDKYDLRVIDIDGEESGVLLSDKNYDLIRPCDWSKDGKFILAGLLEKDGSRVAALVSVPDGTVQVIKELRTGCEHMMFAPDDKGIVYDAPPKEESDNHDIFMLSTENGEEKTLVKHPSHDYVLGWGPDGKHLLFASDRMGDYGAWLLRVINGRPEGYPELIKEGLGDVRPLGFTQAGAYYYTSQQTLRDVFMARLDMETGQVLSEPIPVRQTGATGCHDWSPDGRYLAYCTQRPNESQAIHVLTLSTGRERILAANLPYIRWLRWSLDGQSLLIDGYKRGNSQSVIRRIDTQAGQRTEILQSETEVLVRPELSPDGKTLFYGRGDPVSEPHHLVARDIESGREEDLFRVIPPDQLRNIALSPDGQRFVLSILRRRGQNRTSVLKILSVTGGEPEELIQFDEGNRLRAIGVTWMPDNKYVLFWKWFSGGKGGELWRISTDGGDPRRLWSRKSLGHLRVHPDGERIAFTDHSTKKAVWVMENFLPKVAASVAKPAQRPDFKKIWIPTQPGGGVLSPDGEKLAFVSDGSVWVVPVHGKVSPDIAGEPVRLTEPVGAWDVASLLSWSADGKWIAFNTSDEKGDAIYVIRSSGGTPKKVPVEPRLRNSVYNYHISLSPDGKVVAFSSRYIEKSGSEPPVETGLPPSVRGFFIYMVPVSGGEVRRLTDSASGEPAFSPDGKKIAFVKYYTSEKGELCGSLWVVPAAGGSPIQVNDSDLQKQAGGPMWSPDGKMIAFTSRASQEERRKEICIVSVSETDKASTSPTKIDLPLTTNDMLAGWTLDNKIGVFLHNPDSWAIYTVPASGGHAVQITTAGWATHPQWSPDGQRIYFRWDGGQIAYVPSHGGKLSTVRVESDPPVGLNYPGSGNAISPDGRQIVFSYGRDIYTVPVEGSEAKEIAQGRYPCWSPDGNSIAFIRTHQRPVKTESGWNIYIVPSKGGDVRQLTSDSDNVRRTHIDFSPDGKSIAYFAKDRTLRIVPVQGGESRIVAKAEELRNHDELAWSPDGSKLVYSSKGKIWIVSSDGGVPEEIKTGLDAKAGHVSFSPDGKKLAFTAIKGGEEELYLMENFLTEPIASTAK